MEEIDWITRRADPQERHPNSLESASQTIRQPLRHSTFNWNVLSLNWISLICQLYSQWLTRQLFCNLISCWYFFRYQPFFAGIPGFNRTASSRAFHSAEWIQAIIIQKSREMFQLKIFASLVVLLLLQIHDGKLEKLFREFFSGCNMEKVLILPKWLHYSALWICCERSELLSSGLCDSVTFSAVFTLPARSCLSSSQEKCK